MIDIYLRPLIKEDALISYKWRNNSEVWKYTASKPDRYITKKIETSWIMDVLRRPDEKRFVICIKNSNKYIGNVQLTGIKNGKAEFSIFIGETKYWGKGIAEKATGLILKYAFNELGLKEVYLRVNKDNISAIKAYEKNCFCVVDSDGKYFKMICTPQS